MVGERSALAAGAVVVRCFNLLGAGQAASFALPGFAGQLAAIVRDGLEPLLGVGNLDARRLATFVRPIARTLINVIPYNPGTLPLSEGPSETLVERFVGWLRQDGLRVRRRITKGRTVMAACGQLGGRSQNRIESSILR